jgi:hypothetical protein
MSIDVVIGVVDGKVVARWHEPTAQIVFDPQNAMQVGEALARAAHEARFGVAPTDESYVAAQVRARITEAFRARAINRVTLMLGSMERQRRTPAYIAMQIVDAILRDVT